MSCARVNDIVDAPTSAVPQTFQGDTIRPSENGGRLQSDVARDHYAKQPYGLRDSH